MKDIHTVQYTIRGIPDKLNLSLRNKAKKEHKSLNQVVIECISRGLGLSGEKVYYNDLDDLAGSWKKDAEFDKAIEEMDKIDPELWK
ncbi:MAG: hypothetical protein JXJ04_15795 [Spirochaetales bacterium]|nr:hypothetical protein [Spirochaetales bacterium]